MHGALRDAEPLGDRLRRQAVGRLREHLELARAEPRVGVRDGRRALEQDQHLVAAAGRARPHAVERRLAARGQRAAQLRRQAAAVEGCPGPLQERARRARQLAHLAVGAGDHEREPRQVHGGAQALGVAAQPGPRAAAVVGPAEVRHQQPQPLAVGGVEVAIAAVERDGEHLRRRRGHDGRQLVLDAEAPVEVPVQVERVEGVAVEEVGDGVGPDVAGLEVVPVQGVLVAVAREQRLELGDGRLGRIERADDAAGLGVEVVPRGDRARDRAAEDAQREAGQGVELVRLGERRRGVQEVGGGIHLSTRAHVAPPPGRGEAAAAG